jgi:hypothetical protein
LPLLTITTNELSISNKLKMIECCSLLLETFFRFRMG